MNPLAKKLNDDLDPIVLEMLSERGKNAYYPSGGILAQSAEARGVPLNATIGIATDGNGTPLVLDSVSSSTPGLQKNAYSYAPSAGDDKLRGLWGRMIYEKNPSINPQTKISNPVVTAGLTQALDAAGYLFLDKGETVIIPDLFWDNYNLIFSKWSESDSPLSTFPLFDDDEFNIPGFSDQLNSPGDKKLVLFNAPNNPTGYTPSNKKIYEIVGVINEAANDGKKIVFIADDAYFGYFYSDDASKESIFSKLCVLDENVLAIKCDAATKEDFIWGGRIGFTTYGRKGMTDKSFNALEQKTAGYVRGNTSNSSNIAQNILLKAYASPSYSEEKAKAFGILKGRYDTVRDILDSHAEYNECFESLPFNSGYFMCLKLKNGLDANEVRQSLIKNYGVGVIENNGFLRINYTSVDKESLPVVFDSIYSACKSKIAA